MTKIPNYENSRWRTAAILKMVLSLSRPGITRFQCSLVRRGKLCFQGRLRARVWKFCKFEMADGPCWKSAISQRFIVRLTRNLIGRSKITFRHGSHDQNTKFRKFTVADGRHFENGLSLYLSRESPDFNEIWCADANVALKDDHTTKCQNFANSKWQTATILRIVFGYTSTIYCLINAKFRTKKQNHRQRSRDRNILAVAIWTEVIKQQQSMQLEGCIDDERQFKTAKRSQWWHFSCL